MLFRKFSVAALGALNIVSLAIPQAANAHNNFATAAAGAENTQQPENAKTIRLSDYRKPDFTTDKVALSFSIHDDHTLVRSVVTYRRTQEGDRAQVQELLLNADNPNKLGIEFIRSVKADGKSLTAGQGYHYDEEADELRIPLQKGQRRIRVEIETYLQPQENEDLMGLYQSNGTLVTQNEPQGFRRITPFLDRPDVLATYTVRVEADKAKYPTLLANGDQIDSGEKDGRHWAVFRDPWPKPSYLFATANGNLDILRDRYKTATGRNVDIYLYTEPGKAQAGRHAIDMLKKAMKWDEDVFGVSYDMDEYKIVAVSDFKYGAMENKGLNVFTERSILATPLNAKDPAYQNVTDTTGHEYFHNWSGNRVTLANWFMLSLKEGLTTNREDMFAAYTTSEAFSRIDKVQDLRRRQFTQDDGPGAHPILLPEIRNFDDIYSPTTYQKGAEVIRMMRVLMGDEKFIEGVRHYFKTHDGDAVTIPDFVKRMEDVSGLDLSGQFMRWYTESGRPRVSAEGVYDAKAKTYTLTMTQNTPVSKTSSGAPRFIPVDVALIDEKGREIPLHLGTDTETGGKASRVLHFTQAQQKFVFENVETAPAFHSIFRNFSAPVTVDPGLSQDQMIRQMVLDTDQFNRWEAGQNAANAEVKRLYEAYTKTGVLPAVNADYIEALRSIAADQSDPALAAKFLTLPDFDPEGMLDGQVDMAAAVKAERHLELSVGRQLYREFQDIYIRTQGSAKPFAFNYEEAGKLALKEVAIRHLTASGRPLDTEFLTNLRNYLKGPAYNLTDEVAILESFSEHPGPEQKAAFEDFMQKHKDDNYAAWNWILIQTDSKSDKMIEHLRLLVESEHIDYKKAPGYAAAVLQSFTNNDEQFHRADGKGYAFIADMIVKLDAAKPGAASRLVSALADSEKYTVSHRNLMNGELRRILDIPGISDKLRDQITPLLQEKPEEQKISGKYTQPVGPVPV